jgi:hypothetical protein
MTVPPLPWPIASYVGPASDGEIGRVRANLSPTAAVSFGGSGPCHHTRRRASRRKSRVLDGHANRFTSTQTIQDRPDQAKGGHVGYRRNLNRRCGVERWTVGDRNHEYDTPPCFLYGGGDQGAGPILRALFGARLPVIRQR